MAREQLHSFAIIDETDSIFLFTEDTPPIVFEPGDLVEVEGFTTPGDYAPCGTATAIRKIGQTDLPNPIKVSIQDLHSGQFDAKWVEITGIVRSIDFQPDPIPEDPYEDADPTITLEPHPHTVIKIAVGNSWIVAEIQEILEPHLYIDAKIKLRGLIFYLHNDNRQAVRPILHSTNGVLPEIITPPRTTDFDGIPRSVSRLFTFDQSGGHPWHRVHIRGVVTHHRKEQALWVRDESHSMQIHSSQNDALEPGDLVDVLGFPEVGTYSPILKDAVFSKRNEQSPIEPIKLDDIAMITRHDSDLVQIEAELVEFQNYPESIELTLNGLGTTVSASLQIATGQEIHTSWEVGSIVSVSGIASVGEGEPIPRNGLWSSESLHILLRSQDDLKTLIAAPWWTIKRISYALASILFLAVITIAIIVIMSRRRLREQQQQQTQAEGKFSAILNERNRVAREIHDTLAQNIGAISVQLELVRTDSKNLGDIAKQHLKTAHSLARNALSDTRESIWNMRSQVLEKHDLTGALQRVSKQLTEESEVEVIANVQGTSRRLHPVVENNLLRIGQEALANACKHAKPTRIEISITYFRRRIELRVSDNGTGFDPENVSLESRQSFGLVGIKERIEILGGKFNIQSQIGKGTTIWVEASD
ncbi:sensor histidine kinase [Pelagicoccus sp. SDUM812002]|uniref:sensor histidine kinase n=1 Tax=Pelagicoccus sp. SDUM812002 TaxID=3041266 RepID=UPI00280C63CA|nr:sensor histidine kinase [Pelagicoccus sp. SDUM812002]MDQ8184214.1 sensor histidine kinase [Pelagicoccus sp. SDUM812002]